MRTRSAIGLFSSVALVGAGLCGVAAPSAFAAAQTSSAAGIPVDLGPSPVGLPSNCPFPNDDANFVFLSGNAVSHDTTNANGDWGGFTAEGTARFYEDSTPLYQGHLTVWGGGGNNAKAQTEGGFTADFQGTAIDGSGASLTIHVSTHQTTNASGIPTADALNVNVTCSP